MIIKFSFETRYGSYVDSLHFPDDAPLPSDAELEAMKIDRVANWMAVVEAASNAVEPPAVEEPVQE